MNRPGVHQVPENSGKQGKMEETGFRIIHGAPLTLGAKGQMMTMVKFPWPGWYENNIIAMCAHFIHVPHVPLMTWLGDGLTWPDLTWPDLTWIHIDVWAHEKCRKLVVQLSVVPQPPPRLRDRWRHMCLQLVCVCVCVCVYNFKNTDKVKYDA